MWPTLRAALIAALLFGQALGETHLILVQHRMCPMHGLEHVAASHPGPWRATGTHLPQAAQAAKQHEHERCALVSLLRRDALRKLQPLVLRPPAALSQPPADRAAAPSHALWLFAPKQGPPA